MIISKENYGRMEMGEVTSKSGLDGGPNARNCGRSSPAGAVSVGPGVLDRRNGAVRSSVRSHRILGPQAGVPRRHHCAPAARFQGVWHALRGQSGRLLSLGLADRRIWTA